MIPAVAYYGVRLVTAFRKTWIKVLMGCSCADRFCDPGKSAGRGSDQFCNGENIYKVPNDLRAVCDVIHQNQENDFPRVVFDGSLNSIVRQYDAGIATVISRNASIYRSGSTVAGNYDENSSFYKRQKALLDVIDYHIYEDKEGFQAALKKSKTDFVVTQIGLVDHDFLTECGCELIAQTESCYIYRFDYSKPRK